MRKKETTQTQIRLSGAMDNAISDISRETGMSKNATMLMLMSLGLKVWRAEVISTVERWDP